MAFLKKTDTVPSLNVLYKKINEEYLTRHRKSK
jgi:hypothetical protein